MRSHAQNNGTKATGVSSHAEGASTEANGMSSHAQGGSTKANGDYSHASGRGTIADGYAQTVIGVNNVAQGTANSKASTDYAFIIGNGANNQRSNALGIKWNGNFTFANGTEITPDEFTQMKSGGSSSGSSSTIKVVLDISDNNAVVSFKDSTDGDVITTQEIIQLINNGNMPVFFMQKLLYNVGVVYNSGILSFEIDRNGNTTFYVDSISFESTHITLTHIIGDSSGYQPVVTKEINYNT